MLYIFHAVQGTMMTLDMDLTLGSVRNLKCAISRGTEILPDNQVLLISGGESLSDGENVCHYSAGTDTNPIFLYDVDYLTKFRMEPVEATYIEDPAIRKKEYTMNEKVGASLNLPPCQETVISRTALAQEMYNETRKYYSYCERSSSHQHLLYQAWAAAYANMDDHVLLIKKASHTFEQEFCEFLKVREQRKQLLEKFDSVLHLLSKIPLLPALSNSSKSSGGQTPRSPCQSPGLQHKDLAGEDSSKGMSLLESADKQSLLDWIDNAKDLDEMLQECRVKLAKSDYSLLKQKKLEFSNIIEKFEKEHLKEIQGLGDRLSQLEVMMRDGRILLEELERYTQSFYHNKIRSSSCNDQSIYPSLCSTHCDHLRKMHNNYSKITDTVKRSELSKKELCINVCSRLQYVIDIERNIQSLSTSLHMHTTNLNRLDKLLKVFEQIYRTPQLYFEAIAETVRRNKFSEKFLKWTTELSRESREIWEREILTRKEFSSQMSSHFLFSRFPGLEDLPPPFAVKMPKIFDANLSQITSSNIEMLRSCVPELAHLLVVRDSPAVPSVIRMTVEHTTEAQPSAQEGTTADLFSSASALTPDSNASTKAQSSPRSPGSARGAHRQRPVALLRDQPESETDTDEFEKVCGSISDGTYSPMECISDPKTSRSRQPSTRQSESKHRKLEEPTSLDESSKCLSPASVSSPDEFESPEVYLEEVDIVSKEVAARSASPILPRRLNDDTLLISRRIQLLATRGCDTIVQDLRQQLAVLKQRVADNNSQYLSYIKEISKRFSEILNKIHSETVSRDTDALAVHARSNTLIAQLADTGRELEIYQQHTREHITNIERLECQVVDDRCQLVEEKEECVRRLTLEHELEMEALQQNAKEQEAKSAEEESKAKERILVLENEVCEVRLLASTAQEVADARCDERLREKEESARQLLSVVFADREKQSLNTQTETMREEFNKEKQRLLEQEKMSYESQLNNIQTRMLEDAENRLQKEREETSLRHAEDLTRCSALWEAQKEETLEGIKEQMKTNLQTDFDKRLDEARVQYKQDLEGLRSRFRMMTTANMDKSPSETSLEKFERGDFVDMPHHEEMLSRLRESLQEEKEVALQEMTKALQKEQEDLVESMRQEWDTRRREDERRIEVEKQEQFNSALKDVTQDKERVIEDLRLRIKFLTEETEAMRKGARSPFREEAKSFPGGPGEEAVVAEVKNLKERCDCYRLEVTRLDKELERSRKISFVCESSDVAAMAMATTEDVASSQQVLWDDFQRLTHENIDLKSALKRANLRTRVSLDDAQIHDTVLVFWDDAYLQYRILLEGNNYVHFLHSDSYETLGLSKGPHKPQDKLFCVAQVTKKKEFCQAKKEGNRFNVARGTKFFRVETAPCKPFEHDSESPASAESLKLSEATPPLEKGEQL